MYETNFSKAGVPFLAVRPDKVLRNIKAGIVLDYIERSSWAFDQVKWLLHAMKDGFVTPGRDVIYFEDFWTPGFEMIPYAQSLRFGYHKQQHVPVYSFCHAQSTDPYDFMAPMAWWARSMELGWAQYQNAIVCASFEMESQWAAGGLPVSKLIPCGHTYNADVARRMFQVPQDVSNVKRGNHVVFSSRFDAEKNPHYFLAVTKWFSKHRPEVKFIICTGLHELTSNEPSALVALTAAMQAQGNIILRTGLSKAEYFWNLRTAKVQFNCASQDFVSYALLDAVLNGCAPLYPWVLTFPDALNRRSINLYRTSFERHKIVEEVVPKLNALLDEPWEDYSYVYSKYESSTRRKLRVMGFDTGSVPDLYTLNQMRVDALKEYLDQNPE
jgi:glycosyltransferase involved in cell wall biosynthesis